ncbi:glycoside hydrolase family 43 protein [Cellulomonas soli]|uniref:glycoside hydrolase family 43 protein n=1 Tax=Cellulomonas soli TaxID=931535 RepID=UPI0017E8A274|nr:glycoside hydrolase family 43 protein [Cellulomonas soli]NYI58850.1 alpha-N-arabinofuranosidase [Cellulomonas soli]
MPSHHGPTTPGPVLPVLPGCHPDPSICFDGTQFVLVTSSFTYWPGLPVHVSTDLVHWQPAGHVLTSPGAPVLDGLEVSDGVWAPTVRCLDGVLHVVFTVARDRKGAETYLCTATDPAGPWSEPQLLDTEGFDPALFLDRDGRCWFTACRDSRTPGSGPGELFLRELDRATGRLVGPEHVLWHGALGGAWVEGPRLFERDGRYHLLAAEGGTARHHAVTAATAPAVTGPWTTDPRSPLLTHRHLGATADVQAVGHADLVDGPDGRTWGVVLGIRPFDGGHVLGRETFLVPAAWEDEGPVFAPGTGALAPVPGVETAIGPVPEDDLEWVGLRGPVEHTRSGTTHLLAPRPDPLTSRGLPALTGRRQDTHACTFAATVDADRLPGPTGLAAYQHQDAHLALRVEPGPAGAHVVTELVDADGTHELSRRPVHGPVRLELRTDGRTYRAGVVADGVFVEHAAVPHLRLATEHVGGFVGVLLALVAQGPSGSAPVPFTDVQHVRQVTDEGDDQP